MPKKEPSRKLLVENELRYVRNVLADIRNIMKKQQNADDELLREFNKNFKSLFSGIEVELRLLRQTLVLLLLANMKNKTSRMAFLRMIDFVQDETEFQDFIDGEYTGLLNTKKLRDAI